MGLFTASRSSATPKPLTVFQRRWAKFKSLKRGYYSLIIISTAYAISWLLPLLVNDTALIVRYEGSYYFPAVAELFGQSYFHAGKEFGMTVRG
ncbi:MAG: hypothetical protein ACO3E0_07190 [Candidatus Kapaibacteriota bacterium]